tara:strand:- start:441 stop:1535 length:1095 start_codon:yes stop_codon:yes gene_type:complete
MNKMSAMGSGRPKINRTTFNIGANVLEKRVANNSRKITIIKSILKNQKIDIGEKLTTPEPDKTTEVSKELASINSTLVSIGNILSSDFANRIAIEEGQNKLLKSEKQRRRRSLAESGIEAVKNVGKGFSKITSPLKQGGANIMKALSLLGLGVAGNIAFNLLQDFDSERFTKIFDSIKKNYKWILGTVGVIGGIFAVSAIIKAIGIIKTTLGILAAPKTLALLGTIMAIIAADKLRQRMDKTIDEVIVPEMMDRKEKIQGIPLTDKQKEGFKYIGDATKNQNAFSMGTFPITGMVMMDKAGYENLKKAGPLINSVTLPPIYDKLYRKRKPTVILPETNDVKHVSSVNIGNDYMRKTPKIHGIRL